MLYEVLSTTFNAESNKYRKDNKYGLLSKKI